MEHINRQSTTTYYIACFQVSPNKLFTAAAILKTSDANQKELTATWVLVEVRGKENCRVVAVTAEKKVATVERLSLDKKTSIFGYIIICRSLEGVSTGSKGKQVVYQVVRLVSLSEPDGRDTCVL